VNKVALFCFGLGLTRKGSYSVKDRILGFLTLVPIIFLALTPINAASVVVLSIGGYPSWNKAILGLFIVAFAGWGVNAINHYVDRDRDKVVWSERALPLGIIEPSTVLASAVISLICALMLAWFFFNVTNFVVLLMAIIFGVLYSVYLRDNVGYLSLPPIVGLISLGGWTAFSPDNLFTSWLPWFLYFLHFSWQAAHIMIYYPLHIPDQLDAKHSIKVPPAFFFSPSTKTAVSIGVGFVCLTLFLNLLLPLLTNLGYLYLILILIVGIYGLMSSIKFLRDVSDAKQGLRAFTALSIYRLVTVVAILIDVLLQNLGFAV
jgi:4-hydroxybenzoate polyprenyltransferase